MTVTDINKKIEEVLALYKDKIIALGDEVLANPEIGYREERTSALVRRVFDELSLEYEYPIALTGVKAKLSSGRQGPNVCIIGELDALACQGHPCMNNEGLAHACGHNAQVAAMLGAAYALAKSGVMSELSGTVTFIAAPAEEFIDIAYRRQLKEEGKISFFGGKQQMIYEGAFDDVDMAMMIHAQPAEPEAKIYLDGKNLGFLAKTVTFRGKAAHGSTPHLGTNALNAAALAIIGIHSNRETFRDDEKIRIHPIITKGGDVVNSVPDEVVIDTYVRGATFEAIKKGAAATDRSVMGAAAMIGAEATVENIPGYLPLKESRELSEAFASVCREVLGENGLVYGEDITGSSDIGDLSSILPTIQPSIGGFVGNLHSKEFYPHDKQTAYITSAELLAKCAALLLADDAKVAERVKSSFTPALTKQEYISYLKGE